MPNRLRAVFLSVRRLVRLVSLGIRNLPNKKEIQPGLFLRSVAPPLAWVGGGGGLGDSPETPLAGGGGGSCLLVENLKKPYVFFF